MRFRHRASVIATGLVAWAAFFIPARIEARPVRLASSVEFPAEVLRPNSRGPYTHRAVTSSVTHAAGHVVEMLYDAEEGAQIRDPVSRRIVWVAKTKLAASPPAPNANESSGFEPYTLTTMRPIRFPLRRHDGKLVGSTAVAAGEVVRIAAEQGPYLRVETRELVGWAKRGDLEWKTDRALTALANAPERRNVDTPTPPTAGTRESRKLTPFRTSKSHSYIELVPLTITAEILGRQKYPVPGQKGGFWSTEVSPMDLALAWGPFMQSGRIQAQMDYRQASFQFSDSLARVYCGNFHMYVDDPEVRKQLVELRVGDVVRLKGALIRLEHPRGKANPAESTTTGAYCYSMLCRAIEKVPGGSVSKN